MKMPNINSTTLLTIGGIVLTLAGSIVTGIADDKSLDAKIAKEVAKQLADKK